MSAHAEGPALYAATLTPRDADGRIDQGVIRDYFASLRADGVDRLAVSCHTGRPGRITPTELADLCAIARDAGGLPIAGVPWEPHSGSRTNWARIAADHGATALMLIPPAKAVTADELVQAHIRLAEATLLPVIAFALYASPASAQVDRVLREAPVAGVKSAFLEDRSASRRLLHSAQAAGVLPISGEDLFLAESIAWGYDAALVGLAAAAPQVCRALLLAGMHRRQGGPPNGLVDIAAQVETYTRLCFPGPGDAYIDRMSWIAAEEGRIPLAFAAPRDAQHDAVVSEARQAMDVTQHALTKGTS